MSTIKPLIEEACAKTKFLKVILSLIMPRHLDKVSLRIGQ